MSKIDRRHLVLSAWLCFLATIFYLLFFQTGYVRGILSFLFALPLIVSGSIYLFLGCVRGLTLIPSTYLMLLGVAFLPVWPLYVLTIVGVLVSSLTVYYFSEYLGLDEYLESKHSKSIEKLRSVLQKNELPIVILWSFVLFLPTDVICYVCGSLKVSVYKLLLGIFIGEGMVVFIYIFLGKSILAFLMPT